MALSPVGCLAVVAAVAQHVGERGLLFSSLEARDQCHSESAAFMETLDAYGIEASVVSGMKVEGGLVVGGHFAVLVDGHVWDWTARQFDPAAAVPLVTPWPEWCAEWAHAAEGWTF